MIAEILGLTRSDGEKIRKCYETYLEVFVSYYKTARAPQDPIKIEEGSESLEEYEWKLEEKVATEAIGKGKEKNEHFGIMLEEEGEYKQSETAQQEKESLTKCYKSTTMAIGLLFKACKYKISGLRHRNEILDRKKLSIEMDLPVRVSKCEYLYGADFILLSRRHSAADLLNLANSANIKVALYASVDRVLFAPSYSLMSTQNAMDDFKFWGWFDLSLPSLVEPTLKRCVLIHNIAKRHNVGTLARSATAFGVSELILVGRRDFNSFSSHGSTSHLPFRHFNSLSDARLFLKVVIYIHITESETDIDCDTFIPAIDVSQFQPWYSSFPVLERGIRHSSTKFECSGVGLWRNCCGLSVGQPVPRRLDSFIKLVEVPVQVGFQVQVFIACGVDKGQEVNPFRKPQPGMLRIMEQQF
ncbi:ARID DNA-binding domain-containing protein [Tanacetum coccineum]